VSHYRIEPPFYVSFSGGRTSGYLVRHVLKAWGGALPEGGHVLFANTGREHEATLEFVREVGERWCPVTWIEWTPNKDGEYASLGYRVVSFDSAARSGEPFAALITKKNYLPNPVARFCTSDLKVKPMSAFMRTTVGDDFTTVLGLRADEPRRVARIRADASRDIAVPLADAGVTRDQVIEWWKSEAFDLRLPGDDPAFGNCDLCFLKSRVRTDRVIEAEPARAQWWIDQEERIGGTFRKDRPSYRQMFHQVTVQGQLFACDDDDTLPCDCTE
jgi:3'-phosphoadenosine 5'-phosphosulfate sulfotransferase (PAPS reductase)/FAD synthetase